MSSFIHLVRYTGHKNCYHTIIIIINNSVSDVDECTIGGHNCDENAKCTDTVGSFECACITGYFGSGEICYSESSLYCHMFHNFNNI